MSLADAEAAKPKGEEKPKPKPDDDAARAKKRSDLIKDMSAPVGPEDRVATSPDGSDRDFAMVGAPGGIQDPILMEYVEKCRAAINPNWTPLPSTVSANPSYSVGVVVKVLADGTLKSPEVVRPSGDTAFDRSGIMAVHKTRRFPPPPEKYAKAAANGVLIELLARDKL
jgi:TonB family protein